MLGFSPWPDYRHRPSIPLLGGNDEEVPGKGPTAPMSQSGCFVVRDPLLRSVEGGRTAMPKVFLADDRSMDAVPGWM
jgi:hypothetical protein